jgi:hypothetical protein
MHDVIFVIATVTCFLLGVGWGHELWCPHPARQVPDELTEEEL